MPFLKGLREKFSIEPMFLETLISLLISIINPSTSFNESSNAMPFYEPRTKIAVEKASASMIFFAITVADIEPVLGLRI
jgi:hypothetical protein